MAKMKKIIISGEIGWEVWPDQIRHMLNSANGADLDIEVASPGGYVFDGIEIYNLIRDYKRDHPKSQIMMTIKGLAASMASYLVSNPAIDLRVAEDNAVFMIHNAWGGTSGDYKDMLKAAEILEGLTNIIGQAYSKITGKPLAEIRTMMDDESWFFGEEILEAGFVDEIIKTEDDPDNKKNKEKAIVSAKSKFSTLAKDVSDRNNKTDFEKIAAIMKNDGDEKNIALSVVEIKNKNSEPPASAGKNINPEEIMDFEQFFKENPAAKSDHEKMLSDKFSAGVKEGTEAMQTKMNVVAKYLSPDSNYNQAVKSAAIEVLKGEKSVEFLDMLATSIEAMKEENKSTDAKGETEKLGGTPGEQLPKVSENGSIENNVDFSAEVIRTKNQLGMEV